METSPRATPRLSVLVSAGCPGCVRARYLVEEVRARHPDLETRVVDLDKEGSGPLPRAVVGTPTWLLDGRTRWLGNPSLDEVTRALTDLAGATDGSTGDIASGTRRTAGPVAGRGATGSATAGDPALPTRRRLAAHQRPRRAAPS